MISFLNKKVPRQYSIFGWLNGLIGSQIKKYFFKSVKIFYPLIYSPNSKKPKHGKLLIISEVGGLGDAIMFRRTLEAVKNNYDIILITKKYHLPAYRGVISEKNLLIADSLIHFFRLAKKIKEEKFDALFLHELSIVSFLAVLLFFRNIPYKIGVFANQGKGFLNESFNAQNYKNVLDLYSDLASYLGGQYKIYSFEEFKRPVEKTNQVLIHIGSGSLCKNWRIKNFLELFQMLDKTNIQYKIIGNATDIKLIKKYLYQLKNKPIITESFDELIKLILDSKVVICHNTSILHLALTLKTKTISFNSKSNYNWWNPYKDIDKNNHFAFVASLNTDCGYLQHIKSLVMERNQYGCSLFDSIKPHEVFKIVQKMLNQSSSP